MNPTASVLQTILRWAITSILSYLLAKKVITEELAQQINVGAIVAWAIPLLLPLIWGIYSHLKSHFKLNAALSLPAGSTKADVQAVVSDSSTADIISTQPKPDVIRRMRVDPQ